MEASYRLQQTVGGLLHYAEVAVLAGPHDHDDVAVSDEAFAWRLKAYGPNASIGGPGVAEAIAGVRYVLARPHGDPRRITIIRISDSDVDTHDGDIQLAAVAATCRALGVALTPEPHLSPTGAIFPDLP